ncbi:HD domain-containing protein [Candidatus Uhrbacteria bacterium]|nr:HD domain-containing protein [Candidatus Uhrbacteria bacterium]
MNRDEFFHKLPQRTAEELELIQLAYWLSKCVHRDQERDGGERYFEHPRQVALSLIDHGYYDTETLIIALLHDVVEDTNTPPKVIVNLFGSLAWDRLETISKKIPCFDPVTGEVLDRIVKPVEVYYEGIANADRVVRITKCSDRKHNLSDMRAFVEQRRRKYIDETRGFLLPIARITCPVYAHELELLCDQAEESLLAL